MSERAIERLRRTTGTLTFGSALAPDASRDVRVITGDATIAVPAITSAHLDASTVTGTIAVNGWPIPVTGTLTSHSASGDLSADPSGTLTVRVTTGNITVSASR